MAEVEERRPGRPTREEAARRESLARAELRVRQVRESGLDLDEYRDRLWAPEPPEGWEYEWKVVSIMNAEDPKSIAENIRQGWEAVPRDRHPEMMPVGFPGNTIEEGGLILMERPKVLCEEARERHMRESRGLVRTKEMQLGAAPQGTFDRSGKGVSKQYAPITIPDGE
jgi:hypothetical protein